MRNEANLSGPEDIPHKPGAALRPEERELANQPPSPRATFVLSAGRTGTVSLTRMLEKRFPETVVTHEPFPSRYELLLANFRNASGFGESLLRWLFTNARRRRLAACAETRSYIEVNPLLCPLTDLLPTLSIPLHIVHLVRTPASWARSITAFRASTPFRPIISHLPFATPYPHPRPHGWSTLSNFEKALWRWRFCNEQILKLRPCAASYAIFHYEDLFSSHLERRSETWHQLLAGLPIDFDEDLAFLDTMERANPGPSRELLPDSIDQAKSEICGDLMKALGYDC